MDTLFDRDQLLEHGLGHRRVTRRVIEAFPDGRFQETDTAFGQWTMRIGDLLLYVIDNEVHHPAGRGTRTSVRSLIEQVPAEGP